MKIGPKLKKLSMFKGQFHVYSIFEVFIVEYDYFVLILSTSHDTWCPHSGMTAQKVPHPASLCPEILAGALMLISCPVSCVKYNDLKGSEHKAQSKRS